MPIPPRPDFFGATDIGRVRTTNEDQFLVAELSRSLLIHQTSLEIRDAGFLAGRAPGYLFLVADGLGGAPAGAEASRLAVASVMKTVLGTMPWFFRLEDQEKDLEEELKEVLLQCQFSIEADTFENPSRAGMATTLTMAYLTWPRLYVVHVGDARAYLFREGELLQITEDQKVIQTLPPEGGAGSSFRIALWNVLGGRTPEVSPALYRATLKERDVLLLATDGLCHQVTDDRITDILKGTNTARSSAQKLISAAKEAGGRDNITVVVAKFGPRGGRGAPPKRKASERRPEDLVAGADASGASG